MAVFRQQGALVAKKLEQKEAQVEKAEEARDRLKSKVEDLESKLRQMPGGRMMRGEEFKNYANKLRSKTNQFRQLKQELSELRQESVVLSRTEAILKGRCDGLEEFMEKLEQGTALRLYHHGGKRRQGIYAVERFEPNEREDSRRNFQNCYRHQPEVEGEEKQISTPN